MKTKKDTQRYTEMTDTKSEGSIEELKPVHKKQITVGTPSPMDPIEYVTYEQQHNAEPKIQHIWDKGQTPKFVEKPSKNKQGKAPLRGTTVSCFIIALCGLVFGWDIGTIGGLINLPTFQNEFTNLLSWKIGIMISSFNIGCCVGCLSLSKLCDFYGRKVSIVVSLLIYLLGITLEVANLQPRDLKWIQFSIARILVGLCIGCNCVVAPMFIGEIALLKVKGAMITLHVMMCTLGILLGNVCNYYCFFHITSPLQWKIPIFFGFFFAVVTIICVIIIVPESSVFINSFTTNSGNNEWSNMQTQPSATKISQRKLALMKNPKLGIKICIACFIMIFQQFSGINYFLIFTTMIFANSNPYSIGILISGTNFLSTIIGILIIDKFKRKTLLIYGSVGCFLTMFGYATLGTFQLGDANITWLLVITCLFVFWYSISIGPISFIIISELFPNSVKIISIGIATSFNWIIGFIIGLTVPILNEKFKFKIGYFFSTITFISIFFNFWVVPETKNKMIKEHNNKSYV